MFFAAKQNPATTLTAALTVLLVPAAALDLTLCYDRDYRGTCALKWPMPLNGCYSNRGGGDTWSGFSNDAVSSYKVKDGCCKFYEDKDCMGQPMFESCNTDVAYVGDNYNDKLSSLFCW